MKISFSYIPFRWLFSLLLCILYALMQTIAFQPLLSFPFHLILLKSTLDALIWTGIGELLAVAIPSSNYVKLDPVQRFVNFSALGLVVVLVWVALFFLSSRLVFIDATSSDIQSLLPMALFIGILIYVAQVQVMLRRMVAGEKEHNGELPEEEDIVSERVTLQVKESEGAETLERVVVKVGQKIHVILVPDIVYIQSDGDYVQIVTGQSRFLKEETMKFFETGLSSTQFVRVHRSYIVNIEKILRIEMYEKQNQMITLNNGDKIRASVAGYKALKATLNL